MVLDPLSAFSVACNVLQIVETSLRVLGKTVECYRSGTPDGISTILGNVSTIEALNDELRGSLPDRLGKTPMSPAELRLYEANEQCLRLSGDFIRLLDSLKVTKKSVWHSIEISIKTMWNQDKVASFEKAISDSRANLTLAFLLLMHERSLTVHSIVNRATTVVENRVLDTLKKHTGSLRAEIGKLTSSLDEIPTNSREKQMGELSLEHQIQISQLSEQVTQIWEHQRASDEASRSSEALRNIETAQHRILQSLQFPQMQERKEEISIAYEDTYEWLFGADPHGQEDWHNFVSWARAETPQNIYWIHGKPGSGKSTLARFIFDRLDVHDHLHPWAESKPVIKVAHFFWNPGTTLQKSWAGMLRSLLFQLFDEVPRLSEPCVFTSRWRRALSPDTTINEWTESELLHGIRAFVRLTEARLFFIIDGLDELQGDEERREELVDFVLYLATHNNVKLCISSRPDNIFRDAFRDHPRLKLENLTYSDIRTYVTERFARERCIQTISRGDPGIVNDLISFLVHTASGVFLWVTLVVHELLRAARNGATFTELVDKAHKIPRNLESYFKRFIDSIPPDNRPEASRLFQITLYDEESFETLHGLRLLDLSYVGRIHDAMTFDPNDIAKLDVRLDITARRVNSRCRGLIECYYVAGVMEEFVAGDVEEAVGLPETLGPRDIDEDALSKSPSHVRSTLGLLRACNFLCGLIHRSLRDFLVSPKVLRQLQEYSGGPIDTKLFLCEARLAQIQSLDHEGNKTHAQIALGLSSYILSALGTDDLKNSDESVLIATKLRPIVESLGRAGAHKLANHPWYLCMSFRESESPNPDFLGVAIDFNLVAYIKKELTAEALHDKCGPSVLNCILFGRFSDYLDSDLRIGNRFPNIEVLRLALRLGADPNEDLHGIPIWAQFIRYLDFWATRGAPPVDAQKAHVEAIRALLEFGAGPELPLPPSWLTPGPFITELKSDVMPLSTVLRCMLDLYTHVKRELQECIGLANGKLIQTQAHR